MIFSLLFIVGMTGLLILYGINRGLPLYRYCKYEKEGKSETIEGEIIDRLNQQYSKLANRRTMISVPRVSYKHDGKKKIIDGLCYHTDIVIGSKIDISVYNEGGKHEAWIKNDLPRMVQEFKTRMTIMLVMILLLIVGVII